MKRNLIKNTSIILVLCLTLVTSLFSQNTNKVIPDSRLYQCFEKSYVDNLLKNNPEKIAYYNFYLDHSYYTVKLDRIGEKPITGIDIHKVNIKSPDGKVTTRTFNETSFNTKTFNMLKYAFNNENMNFPTYIWKEMGIAIVIRPEQYIKDDFKMDQRNK